MRLINVNGHGRVIKSPDTIELILEIITLNINYEEMMKEAANKVNILTEDLLKLGFEMQDIKTINFLINSKYENVYDQNGKYSNKFVGYETRHTIKLEFPIKLKLLNDILSAISKSIVKPEITIQFTMKDKDTLKNLLLEDAVKDAIKKAEVLAKAGGVTVGKIQEISYDWQDIRPYSNTKINPQALYKMESISFVPEDIVLNENVRVSFEIV